MHVLTLGGVVIYGNGSLKKFQNSPHNLDFFFEDGCNHAGKFLTLVIKNGSFPSRTPSKQDGFYLDITIRRIYLERISSSGKKILYSYNWKLQLAKTKFD